MACGLKRQNNEGGVTLTERTCSPYNPIIKLMVDDCLGLPIYPVTSVDAVIDEDGNTLRKLLDELLNLIRTGDTEVTLNIEVILTKIEELELDSVNKDTFEVLKTLVYAISSLLTVDESLSYLLDNVFARDINLVPTTEPKIVSVIKKILNQLTELMGESGNNLSIPDIIEILLAAVNFDTDSFNPGNYSLLGVQESTEGHLKIIEEILALKEKIGDGGEDDNSLSSQIENLRTTQTKLQALLVAIANYDITETYDNLDFDDFGLEISQDNILELIEIIYKVKKALDDIEFINTLLGITPGDNTSIVTRITNLENESKTHAPLDPYVLALLPNNTPHEHLYKVLNYSSYPPTSALFLTGQVSSDGVPDGLEVGLLYYFGLMRKVPAGDTLNYYPFGHLDSEAGGWPLYYKSGVDGQGNPIYRELTTGGLNGRLLYAGNNLISGDDLTFIARIITGRAPEFEVELNQYPDVELTYNNLFIEVNGIKVKVGDVNEDGEVNIVDINTTIRKILAYQETEITLPNAVPSPNKLTGWLVYVDNGYKIIEYPCIDGKLYEDINTGKIYRYLNNALSLQMIPVNRTEVEGINIEVDESLQYMLRYDPTDYDDLWEGPYRKITLKVPELIAGKNITFDELATEGSVDSITINNSLTIPELIAGDNISLSTLENDGVISSITITNPIIPESEDPLRELVYENNILKLKNESNIIYESKALNENAYGALEGQYYVDTAVREIYTVPSGNNTGNYTIADVTALIDALLNPNINKINATTHNNIKNVLDKEILKKCNEYSGEQLELLLQIRQHVLNHTFTANNQNLSNGYIYFYKSGNNRLSATALGTYYAYAAYVATNDIDGNGLVNISDVTTLIDKVFTGESEYITTSTQVGAYLMYVDNLNSHPVLINLNEHPNLLGKIFKVEHPENLTTGLYRYDFYHFDSNGEFRTVIPEYKFNIAKKADTTDQYVITLSADNGFVNSTEFKLNLTSTLEVNPTPSIVTINSPLFLGDLVENPSNNYPTNLEIGNGLNNQLNLNLLLSSEPSGVFDIEQFLEDYQLFVDENNLRIKNVSPVAVQSHKIRELLFENLVNISLKEKRSYVEEYKAAKYYSCFDIPNKEVKYILQIVSFSITDPELPINDSNVNTEILLEITDSEPIREDTEYYVSDYGITMKFLYENDELIPIIVNVEQRVGSDLRIDDAVDEAVVDIRPNEFLNIGLINSDSLCFDITNLVNVLGHGLMRVNGTFEGKDNMTIRFVTGTGFSINELLGNPTIESGKTYGYEFYNDSFRCWERTAR